MKHFMYILGTIQIIQWNILWMFFEQFKQHQGTTHKYYVNITNNMMEHLMNNERKIHIPT